jgi:hypothetical protein
MEKEITINGITYVRKDKVKEMTKEEKVFRTIRFDVGFFAIEMTTDAREIEDFKFVTFHDGRPTTQYVDEVSNDKKWIKDIAITRDFELIENLDDSDINCLNTLFDYVTQNTTWLK